MTKPSILGKSRYRLIIHVLFASGCILLFSFPFVLLIMVSLTDERSIVEHGYQLFPGKVSLEAYKYVFLNPKQIVDSYILTAEQAILGTVLSTLTMALCAYPLSRSNFKFRKPLTIYLLITMLFGGGLVPSYILNTKYLGLQNNFWIYVLPCMVSAFSIIIIRTYYQGLPVSMIESAKIDGAGELRLLVQMVLPLSAPVLATVSFMHLLDRWNDWFTTMVYIRDQKLYTLQYLLQRILLDLDFVKRIAMDTPGMDSSISLENLPNESMRFAMAIVVAGPMLVIFPLFQRYFVKGLTIGSVKG